MSAFSIEIAVSQWPQDSPVIQVVHDRSGARTRLRDLDPELVAKVAEMLMQPGIPQKVKDLGELLRDAVALLGAVGITHPRRLIGQILSEEGNEVT